MILLDQKYHKLLLGFFLSIFVMILIMVANSLSVSYEESLNILVNKSVLTYITKPFVYIFGHNDIAVRLPFILLYAASVILMYLLTKDYFKKEIDRLINISLFMLLPGIISASLLINSSIVAIFCTLLYLYYYKTYKKHNYYLLFLFLFVDNSFAILFLALFFYALNKKENRLLVISLVLFGLSMTIYGFDAGGKPRSYFFDTFGTYASIFSPLLFVYFFYSMYRVGLKGNRSIFWYISVTALAFSFLLSFRQRVPIEDFAPYVVITVPIMVKLFLHTLRIRLPEFRTKTYSIAKLTLFIMLINIVTLLYSKPIYLVLDNPKRHFAYDYHFAKEISNILKENGIDNVLTLNYELKKRLEFYGIKEGDDYILSLNKPSYYDFEYKVSYLNKDLLTFYVTDIK